MRTGIEVDPWDIPSSSPGVLGRARHICAFFNSLEEEHRVPRSFITDGFDRNEKAVHIVDPQRRRDPLARLREAASTWRGPWSGVSWTWSAGRAAVAGHRRRFLLTSLVVALAVPVAAEGQQTPKVPRIGALHPGTPAAASQLVMAFKQGLREHGYVEGQNMVVERRFAEARAERLSEIAAELVRLKVDVIVTSNDVGIAAVTQQTQTIPIVMANSTNPVETGFVASLARPGGNVTGLSNISPELSAKRLELLKEAVPGLSRVAIMWNPEVRGAVLDYKETESG
jgi:ABC transporter substrate binding protein